jgi:hypothetical protein
LDGGATWTVSAAPASGLGSDNVVAYPAALYEGGKFGSGSVGHVDFAESADGETWTIVQEAALRPGDSGAFDDWSVLYPAVVRDGGSYRMLYTGFDGSGFAIGRADSADGKAFTRVGAGPVLAKGAAGELDNHAVAQSAIALVGQTWLVWYGAYDTSKTNPGVPRRPRTSADGVHFTKRGLTLELTESGTEAGARATGGPAHREGW